MAAAAVPPVLSNLFSVAGKRAVVTGGGRGIGLMMARTLVAAGADVVISSRSAATCERTAAALTAAGPGKCIALPEDLSTEEGIQRFTSRVNEAYDGKLDILVNNSGIAWGAPLDKFPLEQWDRVMNLNVKSMFSLTRALFPALRAASGTAGGVGAPSRVINIGSVAGLTPQPVPTWSYDVSKAAVHMLTRKFATEFAPSVTVNAIAPGYVPSRMSAGLTAYVSKEAMEASVPMGRWGTEEDIGGALLYLTGRAGAWVTGQVLVVDGGLTEKPLSMSPAGASLE